MNYCAIYLSVPYKTGYTEGSSFLFTIHVIPTLACPKKKVRNELGCLSSSVCPMEEIWKELESDSQNPYLSNLNLSYRGDWV